MLSHSNRGDNNVRMTAVRLDFLLNSSGENQLGRTLPINAKIPFALTHAIKDHLYVPIANEKPSASSSTRRVCAEIPSYHAEQTAVSFSNGLMQPTVCCNAGARQTAAGLVLSFSR